MAETNFNKGALLDTYLPAFSPVSGAISGVTPKVSAWIKTKGVDTIAFLCTTTSTAAGGWTCEVSNDEDATKVNIVNRATLDGYPTFPSGASQNSTVTLPMLGYSYLRLTFTPTSGAGNANAQTGLIVSRGADLGRVQIASAYLYVPAADTLAGTWIMEVSDNHTKHSPMADGRWTDIVAAGDPAITAVAGAGQDLGIKLGVIEFGAVRMKLTPTSGFGSASVFFQGKA